MVCLISVIVWVVNLSTSLLDGIIIRRSIVRAVGIGNLRVADDNHLIMRLLAARQSAQRKIIDFLLLGYSLVEISRAVGC